MEGYITDKMEQRTINGNAVVITMYQREHCDEYLVREVKSGRCSLFCKGILQLSWKEVNDRRTGEFTVYEKGMAWNHGTGLELDEEKELRYQMYCEWLNKNGADDTYLELYNRDGLRWVHDGIVEKSSSVVLQLNVERVVEVNVESRQLLRVNGEEVSGMERNQVLNLSDEGERWEGDVLHDQPYGWGVLYDKEGEKAYEGFRIGSVSVCYGIQYYADIEVIEYEGEICEGRRWGKGKQYDRNGAVLYDGEWLNDDHVEKRMVINDETQFLHNHIEELIVSDKSCNGEEWSVLDLSCMPDLRLLQVGDECFENVVEVKLIGLKKLERVVIGTNSFTKHKNCYSEDPNRHFYLKDCENLKELMIGRYSFSDFSVCKIANVPSLEVFYWGMSRITSSNWNKMHISVKALTGKVFRIEYNFQDVRPISMLIVGIQLKG